MKKMSLGIFVGVLTFMLMFSSMLNNGTVSADDWPEREITVIVPYNPGGSTDLSIRFLQDKIEEYLGVPLVFENMPGVSSLVAQEYFVEREPDGYTVMGAGTIASGANPHIHGQESHIDDYDFVALYMSTHRVAYSGDFETWDEVREYAEENPGTLSFGISGSAFNQMVVQSFLDEQGLYINVVMFGGAPELSAALIGGHIPLGEATIGSPAWDAMEAGDLNPLFVLSDVNIDHHGYPEVPSMVDLGAEVFTPGSQMGMIAPKGIPEERRQKLEDAIKYALETEEVQERYAEAGYEVTFMTGEEFEERARMVSDIVTSYMEEYGD